MKCKPLLSFSAACFAVNVNKMLYLLTQCWYFYWLYCNVKKSKTAKNFIEKSRNKRCLNSFQRYPLLFHVCTLNANVSYCLLYMHQVPGDCYLYTRRIKQNIIFTYLYGTANLKLQDNLIYFSARQSRAHLIDFDQIESQGCKFCSFNIFSER